MDARIHEKAGMPALNFLHAQGFAFGKQGDTGYAGEHGTDRNDPIGGLHRLHRRSINTAQKADKANNILFLEDGIF